MPSASIRRSRCCGLFMIFCSSSTSPRPRVITSSTSGFSSHHGWTWMCASVTGMAAQDSSRFGSGDNLAVSPAWPRTIAVVENDRRSLDELHALLGSAGYRVVSTNDARSAVDLVRDEKPALLLCKLEMPGMDGYEVLKAVQGDAATAACPVVFLSSSQEFGERIRAFRHGVIDYLTRPITPEVLLRKVEQALEGRAVAPASAPTVTEVGPHAELVDPPQLPASGSAMPR